MKKAKPIQWNLCLQYNDYQVIASGEIDIDEALWNMEVALNYTYCMAPMDGGSAKLDLYQFVANDNWYYGEGLGKYPSGYDDWDVARLFTNVINIGIPMPNPSQIVIKKGYYTDPVTATIDFEQIIENYINPNDPTEPGDNILDYLVFFKYKSSGIQNIDKVLFYSPNDEMNFYLQSLEQIKLSLDAQFAANGKTFESLKILPSQMKDENELLIGIYHRLQFRYGIYCQGGHE